MESRYARLSLSDRSNLNIEQPDTPAHIAGLCIVDAAPLLDAEGEVDLEMIRRRLEPRLARVPVLRQIVYSAPPLCGPPLWVDDLAFSIERHVHVAPILPPGDEASLLAATELLLRPLLDRAHPLWQLWFLTGLADGRLGMLFKVHHAIADGLAAVALIMSLLDLDPNAPDPPAVAWKPVPAPPAWKLFSDNARGRLKAAGSTLAHPVRLARIVGATTADSARYMSRWRAAPRTSLNALPRQGRKLRMVHLDLETVRSVAHAHHAKVNDVVLAVVAGGVRDLLIARGEPVEGVELTTSVPATLRNADAARTLGNEAGQLFLWLPVGEADAARRLECIAARTRAAKAQQRPAYVNRAFPWLTAIGLGRSLPARQRMVNFFVTNVPGPTVPLYVLGARVEDVMPVIGLAGNVTLMFGALSYCGHLNVVVTADAAACPDVDVLTAGMRGTWEALAATLPQRATSAEPHDYADASTPA